MIQRYGHNIHQSLYSNIVLTGGSTLFPGLCERLHKELSSMAYEREINIIAHPERKYGAWLGGSQLVLSGAVDSKWITREEYQDGFCI